MIKKPILIATRTSKVKDCRILTPEEFDTIEQNVLKEKHKTLLNTLLWTGMRYVEIQRLHAHPKWYDSIRNNITLDRTAQKKIKRIAPIRYVTPLPFQMKYILPEFFKLERIPSPVAFNKDLIRWSVHGGLDPVGISQKCLRKTIETWLYHAGMSPDQIAMRQGHNMNTAYEHYITPGFDSVEIAEIKKRVGTWI